MVNIFYSMVDNVLILIDFEIGRNGTSGKGGLSGNKSRNGYTIDVLYRDQYNYSTGENLLYGKPIPMVNETETPEIFGRNGTDGCNFIGIELPETIDFFNPAQIINSYKKFARENLLNSSSGNLTEFLQNIDGDMRIESLYDTLSFIDEFEGLEDHYFQLSSKIAFLPFLNSLQNRTAKYAKKYPEPIESKGAFRLLYTMIMSRLNNIKNHENITTIFNLYECLEGAQKQATKFNDIDKELINSRRLNEHNSYLDNKMKSSVEFIKESVMPEIDNIFVEINAQIVELIQEMVERQDKFKNETGDVDPAIIDAIPQPNITFAQNFNMNGIEFSFKFVNSLIGAFTKLGPINMGDNMMIGESIDSKFIDNLKHANGLTTVLNMMDADSVIQENDFFKVDKPKLFLEQLNDIEHEVNKHLDQDSPNELKKIRHKIVEMKSEIIKKLQTDDEFDSNAIDIKREELRIVFKDEVFIQNFPELSEVVLALLSLDEVPVSFYEQISIEDVAKLVNFNKKIVEINKNAINSELVIENIYDIILGRFQRIEKIVNELRQNLSEESDLKLNINKWRVQSAVRDIKAFFRKLSNETAVNEILKRSFDKLDDSMAILLDVYDHISTMADAKSVIRFSENMQYSTITSLNDAILNLKRIIYRNQVLEQYESVMHTFQQHTFPFASLLLSQFDFPREMQSNDSETVISNTIHQIDYLVEKFDVFEATFGEYNHLLFKNVDFSINGLLGPFFTWKNHEIKKEITQLFRGEEIEIKADIHNGPMQNAIKFYEIGIHLKTTDVSIQNQLNTALEKFAISMTMMRACQYRCEQNIHSFPVDNKIVIVYSFKNLPNGEPVLRNDVYEKLIKSPAFLSPYVTWNVKIIKLNDDFDKLKKFENEKIDLDLSGQGQYIQFESLPTEICSQQNL